MTTRTKTTTPAGTYNRDPVPSDRMGTCPCCLKHHRASGRKSSLQRHGWKETGRQIGQHGCGFQWGACIGSGLRPLEQTDADALIVLARLAVAITETTAALAHHTDTGADSYTADLRVSLFSQRTPEARTARLAEVSAAAVKAGAEVVSSRVQDEGRGRSPSGIVAVRIGRAITETVEVSYRDGLRLPTYAGLRAAVVSQLGQTLKAMVQQEQDIKAAVAHHAANPSNGTEDTVKRGLSVHFVRTVVRSESSCRPGTTLEQRTSRVTNCGAKPWMSTTENAAEVTCSRCKKHLG